MVDKGSLFSVSWLSFSVVVKVVALSLSRRGGTLEGGEKNNSLTNKKRERKRNKRITQEF